MSLSPVGQGGPQSPDVSMPSARMRLDNTFATMQEDGKSNNMKIYARVRPMLQREEDEGFKDCIAVIDEQVVRAVVPNSSVKFKNMSQNGQEIYEDFTYTQAFGPETGQFVFFRHTIMDIMQGFIEGQNCLVFSYGITNSGKTFTLQGTEANPGVIPLALRLFFASIKHQLLEGISVKPDKFADILMLNDKEGDNETQLKQQLIQLSEQESINKTNSSGRSTKSFVKSWCDVFDDDFEFETETTLPIEEMKAAQSALYMKELSKSSADNQEGLCSIWVSFVEIYNEYIYDLLQPNITVNRARLTLGEDQNGDVYVKGAREICVSSSDEALHLLTLGRKNLRNAATKLNYQSSRSHCIFTVKVVRLYDEENGRVNRISFCDLAGSERAAKSQTSGVHLKEAGYINTSILVLGKCLEQLRKNQSIKDKKMIPLRESKLTRLFSSHFLGKGRAVMIANASPCELTFDETLNVMRFSALLTTVRLNDTYLSVVSNSLQNITNQWKAKNRLSVPHNESSDLDSSLWEDIEDRNEMIDKLLDLADNLRNNLEKEKREKAELEYKLRAEICQESALQSDEYLATQKGIHESYVQALNEMHKTRIENLEEMYENRISELLSQLQECDSSYTEESSMSINKGNSTLNVSEANSSKIIFASPAANSKAETGKFFFSSPLAVTNTEIGQLGDKCDAINSPVFSAPLQSELLSMYGVPNPMEEVASLKASLELVKAELETAKQELELSSEKLKTAQTECNIELECQELKKEIEDIKIVVQDLESKLGQSEEACRALKNINSELSKNLDVEKEKQTALSEKQTALSEKHDVIVIDKCELLIKLEKQVAKTSELESDCAKYVAKNMELMETIKKLEEECAMLTDKHETALTEKCSNSSIQIENALQQLEEHKLKNIELEEKCSNSSIQLESTLQQLEEHKLKNIALEEKCSNSNIQLDSSLQQLEEHKLKNIDLAEKCSDLSLQLEKTLQDLEEKELKISDLESQPEDLNMNSVNMTNVISELKLQVTTLESKCSALESECSSHKNNYEKILQDYISLEDKFGSLKEKLGTKEGDSDLKSELEKLKTDCDVHKSSYDKVYENYQAVEFAFAALTKDIGTLRLDYEELKKEKLAEADAHDKFVKDLLEQAESYTKEVDELKKTLHETEIKATSYENEITLLKDKLEELSATGTEAVEKIAELEKSIFEKEDRIKELTEAVRTQENCNVELINNKNDIESYKIEIVTLEEELEKAKYKQEQMDKLEEKASQNEEAMTKYADSIKELKKGISEKECKIEELTENIHILENYKTEFQTNESEIESYKEEISNLKSELTKANLLKEQSDLLCENVQKCELLAFNKIKLLDSSAVAHLQEITDLRRQIKEKSSSISELEKALFDGQKQVKEIDAKFTKLVAAKRQDAARIEHILHEKKILETEVCKLKKSVQQPLHKDVALSMDKEALNKDEDANKTSSDDNNEAKHSLTTSKGKKKRSFSDANKKHPVNTEEDALPKRRILRARQVPIVNLDDSFNNQTDDEDYVPKQKPAIRKKKSRKVAEVPKKYPSRKKLQETENMSPVKKAMQFVGSKIRSVAQSASNMTSSPRLTRGRRKLFNADAKNKAEPKWRP